MNKMHLTFKLKVLKKNLDFRFLILFSLIFFIALLFRIYNFENRVFLMADSARDYQVSLFAKRNFILPQIGQFSSSGPFFYGPWYYWFLEIVHFLPFGFLTPWYVITSLSMLFVYLIYFLGKELGNRKVGLISSLLAAISPALIYSSTYIWNVSVVSLLVLVSLLLFIRFIRFSKPLDLLLLSFVVILSWTIHFQNILIFPSILLALFSIHRSFRNLVRYAPFLVIGVLIPLLPLLLFDVKYNWYETRSILVYLLVDQYRIWVPNRWLTYLLDYWPKTWGNIVGGGFVFGSVLFVGACAVSIQNFVKSKVLRYLIAVFFIEFILFRFYRGERFPYLSHFAEPAVIVLSALFIGSLFKIIKFRSTIFFTSVIAISTVYAVGLNLRNNDITYKDLRIFVNILYATYPRDSFDLYSCSLDVNSISHPVSLIMYYDRRNSDDGIRLGVCSSGKALTWQTISDNDLQIRGAGQWFRKNTSDVYADQVEWWRENPPKKGDNFWKFILKSRF